MTTGNEFHPHATSEHFQSLVSIASTFLRYSLFDSQTPTPDRATGHQPKYCFDLVGVDNDPTARYYPTTSEGPAWPY
jgi:hypothetical protein